MVSLIALLSGILVLHSQSVTVARSETPIPHYDIAIIGAGTASLSVLHHLTSDDKFKGAAIGVIEARNRWFGRHATIQMKNNQIEMAMPWINGALNPLYQIAVQHKLIDPIKDVTEFARYTSETKWDKVLAVTQDGNVIPNNHLSEISGFIYSLAQRYNSSFDPDEAIARKYNNSMGAYLEDEMSKYLKSKSVAADRSMKRAIIQNYLTHLAIKHGAPNIHEMALKDGFVHYLPGKDHILRGGWTGVLSAFKNQIFNENLPKLNARNQNKTTITEHLNQEVVRIIGGDEVGSKIGILTHGGHRFTCNQVVNTMPLAVFKAHGDLLYKPKQKSQAAAQKLGMIGATKFALEFSEQLRPKYIPKNIDEIFLIWEDLKVDEPFVEKSKSINEHNWFKAIPYVQFYSDNLLMGFIQGEEGVLSEMMDPKDVGLVITKLLRIFLKNPSFPDAETVHIANYTQGEPFTLGSSMYLPPSATREDIYDLCNSVADPSGLPKTLYAGYPCHERHHSLNMVAFWSGRRAAEELVAGKVIPMQSRGPETDKISKI